MASTAGLARPVVSHTEEWRYSFLWDVAMVLSVIAGGIVSVLVLGEVLSPSKTTRWLVVVAGFLSLTLLATHMLWSVTSLYRSHLHDPTIADAPSVQ